tara:strand:+ start:542 stop:1219 length:678 start_codon:yes stop_codon:yes gene_type:complete
MEYKLRKRLKYGDYRDVIDQLVSQDNGQMSFDQYQYIYEMIKSKGGCNLLVFGLGNDSMLWDMANTNGKTIFLEDIETWIEEVKNMSNIMGKTLDIRKVTYTDIGRNYKKLLEDYENGINNLRIDLDDDIKNIKWDAILVDGPICYNPDVPCRMKSLYEAFYLSKLNNEVDVFIHDVNKLVVKTYVEYFYKEYELIKTLGGCRCNNKDWCKCNILKHFKWEKIDE